MSYTIHTIENAPAAAKPVLEAVKGKFGMIPNLLGLMAGSPETLKGYLTLADLFAESPLLSGAEKQVVIFATSVANDCNYCVTVHTVLNKDLPQAELDALLAGKPLADAKLQALRVFTEKVVNGRAALNGPEKQALTAAGYTEAQVLAVLLGVAQKTLSNYVNHLAETPLDQAFAAKAWKK